MNGNSSKTPTTPPLPLRGTSPKGGSKGLCGFALVRSKWDSAYRRKPLRRDAPPPLSGAVKLGSPVGELSSVSETEGVSFVEWELLKVPDYTPFAAARSTTPRGGSERALNS